MKYTVRVVGSFYIDIEVEAENWDHAEDIAGHATHYAIDAAVLRDKIRLLISQAQKEKKDA